MKAIQPSATGEIRYASGAALRPEDTAQISDLLAVWRTLHVPLERMDDTTTSQDQFELQSKYSSIGNDLKTPRDKSVSFQNCTTPDGIPDHPANDGWRGAQLADIVATSGARVTGNGTNHVNTATPLALRDTQKRYRLFDDELAHLAGTTHDTSSILAWVLWPLYVQLDTTDPPQYRPFERYLPAATQQGWAGVHVNDVFQPSLLFPQPGEYRLRLAYIGGKADVLSNAVQVKVEMPAPEELPLLRADPIETRDYLQHA